MSLTTDSCTGTINANILTQENRNIISLIMRYNRPVIIETSLFGIERSKPQWHALFLFQKIRVNV